jgi:uncharacterized protein YxeA
MSFLSGNLPICIILTVSVLYKFVVSDVTENKLLLPAAISIVYFLLCIFCAIFLLKNINSEIQQMNSGNGGTPGMISKVKIQNIFSSGAMTYYILPFISFAAGDDLLKNEVILFILIAILGLLYVRERMIIYTPVLGVFNYIVFSAHLYTDDKKDLGETLVLMRHPDCMILGPLQEYRIIYKRIGDFSILGVFQ